MIVGGGGPKRTPYLAARFADEFNLPFSSPDNFQAQVNRVKDACETIGRDPNSLTYSVAQVLCVGESEDELIRRASSIGRELSDLIENGVAGTLDQARARIQAFHDVGATRIYLQVLDEDDLDHISLLSKLLTDFQQVETNA